jgi:hypothetical protein
MIASAAGAQCTATVSTDLVGGFRASRPAAVGEVQDPTRSAWSYRHGSASGPLLSGRSFDFVFNYWGDATQPFTVPTVGPIYSPSAGSNEVGFADRAPSFIGVLMHPGYDVAHDSIAVFSPQNPVTILSVDVDAEVLGNISDGVSWQLATTIGGLPGPGIPSTVVPYSAGVSHQTFSISPGQLPITLNPGDTLTLRTSNAGQPFEDWANTNLRMNFSGGPVLLGSPRDAAICADKSVSFTATVAGSGTIAYLWQFREGDGAWNNIADGPLAFASAQVFAIASNSDRATLDLTLEGDPDVSEISFRCIASNACHSVTSASARARSCIADRNCDGVVDLSDYFEWFNCWDLTQPCADIDGNSEIDLGDFFGFFSHWDLSC